MKQKKTTPLQTAAVVSSVFAAIAAYLFYKGKPAAAPLLIGAVTLFTLSLLSRKFAAAFEKAWFKLGHVLGAVNSRIILSIVYFGFLVPLAYLRRLGNAKRMQDRPLQTNFKSRNHTYTPEDFTKPW